VVSYPVIVEVPNPGERLRPKMTANVTIDVATVRNVLRIANAALRFKPPEGTPGASGATGAGAPRNASETAPPPTTTTTRTTTTTTTAGTTSTTGSAAAGGPSEERRRRWRERMAQSGGSNQSGGGQFGGRGQFGGGGVAGAAGAFGQATAQTPPRRPQTVYLLDGDKKLVPAQIRTGISDGRFTEVVDGNIKVGDTIVIGLATSKVEGPAAFGGGMGGAGGRPGGGGGGRPPGR